MQDPERDPTTLAYDADDIETLNQQAGPWDLPACWLADCVTSAAARDGVDAEAINPLKTWSPA